MIDVNGRRVYVASTHAYAEQAREAAAWLRDLGAHAVTATPTRGMATLGKRMMRALSDDIDAVLASDLVVLIDDNPQALVPEAIIADEFEIPVRMLSEVLPVAA
ncbi:hypothetical protein [Flindersiella endophytica]